MEGFDFTQISNLSFLYATIDLKHRNLDFFILHYEIIYAHDDAVFGVDLILIHRRRG